jgi:elongation factor P--(R)-beta-lysine ligase
MNNWCPTANQSNLKLRAETLAKIRDFFAKRHVLEVETPLLGRSTNPAAHLHSFVTKYHLPGTQKNNNYYLQTSPEFAMKRLLAAGSGDIYQICKAFRDQETGRLHNPEFTILEWYRLGFDHHKLMDEVDAFLKITLKTKKAQRITYAQFFLDYFNLDLFAADINTLKTIAQKYNLSNVNIGNDKDAWLQLLFMQVEPKLGIEQPVFIYDYPPSQAMLAKIRPENPPVASRFEVYYRGIELANGFHELNNIDEQRKRFLSDLQQRQELNLSEIPLDESFLAALPQLPNCAGVAIGVDRLIMLAAQANTVADVVTFTIENA